MSPSVALRLRMRRMLSNVLICLDPFFRHNLSETSSLPNYPVYSPPWLRVPRCPKSTHQLKSLFLIPSIRPFDKSFRLKVPTITEFSIPLMLLAQMNFYHLPTLLYPPSMRISDRRIQYLGHILRHPDSPESLICFNPSRTLRTISSPFRRGARRAGLNSG